uniref:Uncharacterized protein n=1 Tax=Moniliophthora roreri TaxID=221103 RepID=A0A0W0FN61_MONRR
MSEAMEDTHLQ